MFKHLKSGDTSKHSVVPNIEVSNHPEGEALTIIVTRLFNGKLAVYPADRFSKVYIYKTYTEESQLKQDFKF